MSTSHNIALLFFCAIFDHRREHNIVMVKNTQLKYIGLVLYADVGTKDQKGNEDFESLETEFKNRGLTVSRSLILHW